MKDYTRLLRNLILVACLIFSCEKKEEEKLPEASFTFEIIPNTGIVNFTNTSKNATVYSWNFGHEASGDNSSSLASPAHTFPGNDNYTVTLTADPSMPHPFDAYSQVVTITDVVNLYGTYNFTSWSITSCTNPGGNYPLTNCGVPGVVSFNCSQFVGTGTTITTNGVVSTYLISGNNLVTTTNGVPTNSTFTLVGTQLTIFTPTSGGCILVQYYTKA